MTSARHGSAGASSGSTDRPRPPAGARLGGEDFGSVDSGALASVLDDFASAVAGDFTVGDILRLLGSGAAREPAPLQTVPSGEERLAAEGGTHAG